MAALRNQCQPEPGDVVGLPAVNCVAPATVALGAGGQDYEPRAQAEVAAMSPLGRMGIPEDVAVVTVFLASESAGWLTGVTVDVAGGRFML